MTAASRTPRPHRRFGACVAFAICALHAGGALAQDSSPAAAEALFRQGREAMDAKSYDVACERFRESDRLDPAVGTLFNLARCELLRGRLATAWALYRKVAQKLPPRDKRIPVAQNAADELEPRLPMLTVVLPDDVPEGTTVERGGMHIAPATFGLPLPVDPGSYEYVVKAPGFAPMSQTVTVAEGDKQQLTLQVGEVLPPQEPEATAVAEAGAVDAAAQVPVQPAADDSTTADPPEPAEMPRRLLNLSVFHPLSFERSHEHIVNIELGLIYGHIGALHGVGGSVGMTRTGEVRGAMINGLVSYVEGGTTGATVTGMMSFSGGPIEGIQLSGMGNLRVDVGEHGKQRTIGAQIAGLGNLSVGPLDGLQLAALGNVQVGDGSGLRMAVMGNAVIGEYRGLMFALFGNAALDLRGVQFAALNVARDVKGLQIGLINVANEVEGASIGIIPVSIARGAQPVVWVSSAYPVNAGVRLESGYLVTTPSVSYSSDDAVEYAVPGITIGVPIAIGPVFVEPDIGYRLEVQAEQFEVARHRTAYRLGVAWQPHSLLRLHAGGGVMQSHRMVEGVAEAEPAEPLAFFGVSTLH